MRIVVHHYTPPGSQRRESSWTSFPDVRVLLGVDDKRELRFRDIFTTRPGALGLHLGRQGDPPRKFSRHATLADMLVSCAGLSPLRAVGDRRSATSTPITAPEDPLQTQPQVDRVRGRRGEAAKTINPKVILGGQLAENIRSTAMVIKCCRAVETEWVHKFDQGLSSALKQDSNEDVTSPSMSVCCCASTPRSSSRTRARRWTGWLRAAHKLYKQKREEPKSRHKLSTSLQASQSPQQVSYEAEDYDMESRLQSWRFFAWTRPSGDGL